jgi:hypothetical protein
MKHSHKEKKPKGCAKGRKCDEVSVNRSGPIMTEDILKEAPWFHKSDTTIREMMIRADPANNASPFIKRKFKPSDNPARVLELLQSIAGNNVTTGPSQCCIAGKDVSQEQR